jgi:hypothetical protein
MPAVIKADARECKRIEARSRLLLWAGRASRPGAISSTPLSTRSQMPNWRAGNPLAIDHCVTAIT